MDIQIKYDNGFIVIHLENFMQCQSIAKFKKLLKLIRNSSTPECEAAIWKYIRQEMEEFEVKQAENKRYIVGYSEKTVFCQKQLDRNIAIRGRFKKSDKAWDYWNQCVKEARQELKGIKALLRSRELDHDKNIRMQEFYKRVLENIT